MKKVFIGICDVSFKDAKTLIQYLEIAKTALNISFEICVHSTGLDDFFELKNLLTDEQILNRPYVWASNQKATYKLYLYKLRYIETCNRQLIFHYENEKINIIDKLSDFENRLSEFHFFRCNNSYLVNIDYIDRIEKDLNRYVILLITGERIPLSRNKKKELIKLINDNRLP